VPNRKAKTKPTSNYELSATGQPRSSVVGSGFDWLVVPTHCSSFSSIKVAISHLADQVLVMPFGSMSIENCFRWLIHGILITGWSCRAAHDSCRDKLKL